jgi:hypothetical protein
MITIDKIFLFLLISSVSLFGNSKPHIVESPACQQLLYEYNEILSEKKKYPRVIYNCGENWFDKKRNTLEQKEYAAVNNAKELQKINELKECIGFIEKFPYYQQSVNVTSVIFKEINPKKVPNSNLINRINDIYKIKEVTKKEALKLFESEQCQNIYRFCEFGGKLDKERIQALKDAAYWLINHRRTETVHVSSDPLNPTKEIALTPEKMIPEHISQKAEVLHACLILIEHHANLPNLRNMKTYLKPGNFTSSSISVEICADVLEKIKRNAFYVDEDRDASTLFAAHIASTASQTQQNPFLDKRDRQDAARQVECAEFFNLAGLYYRAQINFARFHQQFIQEQENNSSITQLEFLKSYLEGYAERLDKFIFHVRDCRRNPLATKEEQEQALFWQGALMEYKNKCVAASEEENKQKER